MNHTLSFLVYFVLLAVLILYPFNMLRYGLTRSSFQNIRNCIRDYAAPAAGKKAGKGKGVAAVVKKKDMEVETDANKLVNFCCINFHVNEEPIPLKPDHEYPDWLWKLPLEDQKLSDLDPNSYAFWRMVRRINNRHWNKLASIDGYRKREHRINNNHLERFYGDWYLAIQKWEKEKSLGMMPEDAPKQSDSNAFTLASVAARSSS